MANLNVHWRGFWNYNNGAYTVSAIDSQALDFGLAYSYQHTMTTNDIYITFNDNESVRSFLMVIPRPSVPYPVMWVYVANNNIDINSMSSSNVPSRGRLIFDLRNQNPFNFDITEELVEEVKSKGIILSGEHNGNERQKMLFKPTFTITSEYPNATISSLLQQGSYWEQAITVSWLSTYQAKYEIELWQNNVKIGSTRAGTTSTSYTIPSNTFSSKDNALIKVRVANPQGIWTSWTTLNLSLKDIEATISDLSINAENIDYDIPITWTSQNQSKWKLECIQSGVIKNTFSGASQKSYTIPAKSISVYGSVVFRLSVAYASFGNVDRWVTRDVSKTLSRVTSTSSNLIVTGDLWEKEISLSWQSANQNKYEVTILKDNVLVKTYSGTTATSLKIPSSTLSAGEHTFRVRTAYTGSAGDAWSAYTTRNATLKDVVSTISNVIVSGELWEAPINLSWQSINQQQFKIEVLSNNVVVKTYTGTTAQNYTIAAGQLSKGENVFRIWVGYANRFVNNQIRNVTLKDIEATISNLLVEGELWEKPIRLSWKSVSQEQFKIEVFKGNALVTTYTGTTAASYTIQSEQLTDDSYTFKVWVGYKNRFVNYNEKTVNLRNIYASINNLTLSGSNIDLNLTFAWGSTDQQKYEVEIYKDADKVKSYNGTTDSSVLILHSSLTTGLHKFKVRVAFKDRWTDWQGINATLTETLPSIGVLEPDGVITERDDSTRVWWTSNNQSKWKIIIDESITYTGTTEKEKILTPGALQTGKHSIVLTVTYVTGAGVEKHITKKAEWIVQGKPPIPTITSADAFSYSRPLIVWDTQDQQGYILEILKDNVMIYSTDWENGLVTEHKITNYLANGTYTVRVKVKNQFSLESDYGTKQITINAQESTQVALKAIRVENSIRLTWDNMDNRFIKFYIIRNGEVIAKTTDTSYLDHTAFGECIYTIRGITATDVYKDSNNAYTECTIRNGLMSTVNKLDDLINVGISRNEFNFDGSVDLSSTQVMLNGRELPVTIFGEHSLNTFNINFTSKELFRFIEMCKRRKTFLYRDKRQKLYLCITNPSYKIDSLGLQYSVPATEVDYKEVIQYD